ncbi:CRISPR-associated endonuclease Cas1 [Patescibacteria group bacterium]|nr:CRISPR-associated endonuclease Cas1 [Patescibacteria group bacterium]
MDTRTIIKSKIQNMELVTKYIYQNSLGTSKLCKPYITARKNLEQSQNQEEIMGIEGAATKHYFNIYGKALPEDFSFVVRSRRPAQDPANAILNLGYMMLLREIQTHLEAHHLDPYIGFLHSIQDGRPSLALDILEEFRQPFIDLFILKIIRHKQIGKDDFQVKDGGVVLTDDGFRKFFNLYEKKMGDTDGENPGLRQIINKQVYLLKKHILGEIIYQSLQLA